MDRPDKFKDSGKGKAGGKWITAYFVNGPVGGNSSDLLRMRADVHHQNIPIMEPMILLISRFWK